MIQTPRQKITTMNVSALTTRPAQVCSSALSAWLMAVSLPDFHSLPNKFFKSILRNLVIGGFLCDDDIVRMTFNKPGVGDACQPGILMQVTY